MNSINTQDVQAQLPVFWVPEDTWAEIEKR